MARFERQVFANALAHFYQLVKELSDADAKIDSLYLSFLVRPATENEKAVLQRNDLPVREIAWILANTREFIFVQ